MAKPLNMTAQQRGNVKVTFNVNRFEATIGFDGPLVGKYYSQAMMLADFRINKIVDPFYDLSAQRKMLVKEQA